MTDSNFTVGFDFYQRLRIDRQESILNMTRPAIFGKRLQSPSLQQWSNYLIYIRQQSRMSTNRIKRIDVKDQQSRIDIMDKQTHSRLQRIKTYIDLQSGLTAESNLGPSHCSGCIFCSDSGLDTSCDCARTERTEGCRRSPR